MWAFLWSQSPFPGQTSPTKDYWQSWRPLVIQHHRTPMLGGRGGRHLGAVSRVVRAPGPDFPPLSHRSTGRNPWPLKPSAAGLLEFFGCSSSSPLSPHLPFLPSPNCFPSRYKRTNFLIFPQSHFCFMNFVAMVTGDKNDRLKNHMTS